MSAEDDGFKIYLFDSPNQPLAAAPPAHTQEQKGETTVYINKKTFRAFRRRRQLLLPAALLALTLTVALTAAAEHYQRTARAVCADTLRLHILANSDTPADQLRKLKARQAVLGELAPLLAGAADKAEALARVQAALPRIRQAAGTAAGQPAAVRLEQADFVAKAYDGFALPAGEYTALRVELGQGSGHNWFCVLYPELCLGTAGAEYPTDAENKLVFGRYRVRFALWDLLTGRK